MTESFKGNTWDPHFKKYRFISIGASDLVVRSLKIIRNTHGV